LTVPVRIRTARQIQTSRRKRQAIFRNRSARRSGESTWRRTGTATSERNSMPPIQMTAARMWSHRLRNGSMGASVAPYGTHRKAAVGDFPDSRLVKPSDPYLVSRLPKNVVCCAIASMSEVWEYSRLELGAVEDQIRQNLGSKVALVNTVAAHILNS